jgi:hypothetical protein
MATTVTEAPTGSILNGHHDADLAKRADGLSLNGDRPASRASYRNAVPNGDHNMAEPNQLKQDSIAGSDVRPRSVTFCCSCWSDFLILLSVVPVGVTFSFFSSESPQSCPSLTSSTA